MSELRIGELRIGDMVRTPLGDGTVLTSPIALTVSTWARRVRVGDDIYTIDVEDIERLPADIPRERVADLHAAVTKRVEQLAAHGGGTVGTWLHAELSEVAEALRLLLEVDHA